MLLIDEIDRADEEFEAFLLEVLSDFQITIPELGTIRARRKPAVVLTSNRTRELHDALKRRALFHWIGHPSIEREIEIVTLRIPGIPERLAAEAAAFVRELARARPREAAGRRRDDRLGAGAHALGREEIDADVVEQTLGSVLKYREDIEAVRDETLARPRRKGPRDSDPVGAAGRHAVVRHVVTFGRVLREVGLEVGPGRVADAVHGLDAVDLTRQEDVYFTLRQTLVSRHDELELFDRAFVAWFLRGPVRRSFARSKLGASPIAVVRDTLESGADGRRGRRRHPLELGASGHELLRDKDFAEMTPDEFERVRRLMAAIARRARAARRDAAPLILAATGSTCAGCVASRCARAATPVEQSWKARKTVPRKLVVLCDVSGSMDAYARALLFYLHAIVGTGAGVEAFAFGTRLTRLTSDLATRDPEAALARANEIAVDWGSGTRIGASLAEFNAIYGRRALSRGAVVVIVSDGWERDDPDLVGREMAKLARAAFAVVWVNPLKGNPEYQPLAGGMRAALPFVDRFLPGHNLRSLEELGAVLAGIERRHAA